MQFNSYLLFNGDCEEAFKRMTKSSAEKSKPMLTHEGTPAHARFP